MIGVLIKNFFLKLILLSLANFSILASTGFTIEGCSVEVSRHCSDMNLDPRNTQVDMLANCLRLKVKENELSVSCRNALANIPIKDLRSNELRAKANDSSIHINYRTLAACNNEIRAICNTQTSPSRTNNYILECLEQNVSKYNYSQECKIAFEQFKIISSQSNKIPTVIGTVAPPVMPTFTEEMRKQSDLRRRR